MIPKTRKEAFEVLKLSESASEKEIKEAYHTLIKKWHPDKRLNASKKEKGEATEKFKKIIIAYKILTDEVSEEFVSQ